MVSNPGIGEHYQKN